MTQAMPIAPTQDWSALLQRLIVGESLNQEQAETLMRGWLSESIPDVVSGGLLAALQAKGVSAAELAGMARVLQGQSLGGEGKLHHATPCIDTCGTGGEGAHTVNLSTAVAFVAAAAATRAAAAASAAAALAAAAVPRSLPISSPLR